MNSGEQERQKLENGSRQLLSFQLDFRDLELGEEIE